MPTKLITLCILIMGHYTALAQNDLIFNTLKVNSIFNKRDSVLTINYKYESVVPHLMWTGDFIVAAITTRNDVSSQYLTSPVVNEIYLLNKAIKQKQTTGYFLRQNKFELNLKNYTFLNNQNPVVISFKIKNDTLLHLLIKKKINVRLAITLIDYTTLATYLSSLKDASHKILYDYLIYNVEDKNISNVFIKNIKWIFNRTFNKEPSFNEMFLSKDNGNLSESLISNYSNETISLPPTDLELLYRFANKMYLTAPLKIIN